MGYRSHDRNVARREGYLNGASADYSAKYRKGSCYSLSRIYFNAFFLGLDEYYRLHPLEDGSNLWVLLGNSTWSSK